MQRVTSRQNPRLREAERLLRSSRDRRKEGRCVLEGAHLITSYADRCGPPETLIVTDDALDRPDVRALLDRFSPRALQVTPRMLAELAAFPPGIGIVAVVVAPGARIAPDVRFGVLLEDLQDPGNVGSILRSAAAAGVDQVLLSKACAFAWSPKVLRAGQGAHFALAIAEDVDLPHWAAQFRREGGRLVATTVGEGIPIDAARLTGKIVLAIGNEGAGISATLAGAADARVNIPMHGGIESLNVAAAAAVCLFECARQRRLT